jgi:hypothetical protein
MKILANPAQHLQRMGMFDELEAQSFDTFDDAADEFDAEADDFDADSATGPSAKPRPRRALVRSSFDLIIQNSALVPLNIELFQALNSLTIKQRTDFINGAYAYIPLESYQGIATGAGSPGTVGFNSNGELQINGAVGAGTLRVSCQQFPYRGLLQSSALEPFRVERIRMNPTTPAQLNNEIVHVERTFLGARKENRINPRTYFSPNQFQSLIVDIKQSFVIDRERGLEMLINAGETLQLNFTVQRLASAR